MTVKPAQSPGESRESRPRRAPARAEADAQAQALERLRDDLLRRLDVIESLASEQAALLDRDSSERERTLRDRVVALEAANARIVAEARRREQEWQEVLKQLETDRRLLAEAWERLEQQQTQIDSRAETRPTAAGPAPPDNPKAAPAAARPADDPDEAVTRAILQQFQALSNDVRRNARNRGR